MPAADDLDDLDHQLLALLQDDCDRTLRDLGDLVGLSPSAVQRRLERLKSAGVLTRRVAVVDVPVLRAICLVSLDQESTAAHRRFRESVLAAPEVQQCYNVSGDHDYVVVLTTTGMEHHVAVADRVLKDAPNIRRYSTMFVLDPLRTGSAVPTRREPRPTSRTEHRTEHCTES
ncbi:Lrp/AsnC family transcriptional regulator [Actinokineospora sp. NBRC 105648]|uniref:Lrp/AsnC family transcriptional regulator n=1 Tax=Actinokineospora sp. NBRC 105648 TaxID=3032206 RepID=UPI0024A0C86C|nr:Lrp/AsnC family transcriptional regulator [Actinokineospora sp. NBRC 105648]GLZ38642.1 ArsR family transcriptional regulator [Actinokineospora sp. NBRC 105648]